MPYIDKKRRPGLLVTPLVGVGYFCSTTGELNFCLTTVILGYLREHGLSYATINDIRGALAGAQAEFERRVAFPYEDEKIQENGDVYP